MKPLSFLNPDPQEVNPQYLEDLAAAYWFSEALFTAVEMGIFTFLDPMGKTIAEIARALESDCHGVERFLQALCAIGLLQREGPFFFNTKIASEYLVKGKKDYQGEAILWRKYLSSPWRDLKECIKAGRRVTFPPAQEEPEQLIYRVRRFIRAMDCVARTKVREIIPIFEGVDLEGEILDVGAGSGAVAAAFLERFPSMRAILMDLPEALDYAEELMRKRGITGRVTYCQANILVIMNEAGPISQLVGYT